VALPQAQSVPVGQNSIALVDLVLALRDSIGGHKSRFWTNKETLLPHPVQIVQLVSSSGILPAVRAEGSAEAKVSITAIPVTGVELATAMLNSLLAARVPHCNWIQSQSRSDLADRDMAVITRVKSSNTVQPLRVRPSSRLSNRWSFPGSGSASRGIF